MKVNVIFKHEEPDFEYELSEFDQQWKAKSNPLVRIEGETFHLTGNIDKITHQKNANLDIIVGLSNGQEMTVTFKNMTIFESFDNGVFTNRFGASDNLIKSTHEVYNKKYDITRFYFYLKPRSDYLEIIEGLYVLEDELPIELKN